MRGMLGEGSRLERTVTYRAARCVNTLQEGITRVQRRSPHRKISTFRARLKPGGEAEGKHRGLRKERFSTDLPLSAASSDFSPSLSLH